MSALLKLLNKRLGSEMADGSAGGSRASLSGLGSGAGSGAGVSPNHFMIDTYFHEGKDTFLGLLKALPSEDLKDACSELFSLGLNALLSKDSKDSDDTDLVIFNNLLQRREIQNYLADEYVWDDAKLFCLPLDSFCFFVEKFFAGAGKSAFSDLIDRRFRGDLINNQLSSLSGPKSDGKEWQKYAQEKLMSSIFALDDKETQAQVLRKSLEFRGSLASFLGATECRSAIQKQLDVLEARAPMPLGSFSVYTSSFWDPTYRAEKAAKRAEEEAIYALI
jgi:hypothetical protein